MENTHRKIRIIAEKDALIQLGLSKEFREGKTLKHIFRNLADIFLIMDEGEFEKEWMDYESDLRKFFGSYDMPQPRAIAGLTQIYRNPAECAQIDPFALWLFNRSEQEVNKFRDYLGVWALTPQVLSDNYFSLEHSREFDKNDVINGTKDNGWGNYFEELSKALPPVNSIVLNDRHLLYNTNEKTALEKGFYGLNNLKALLNELLPQNLKIPFHILIFCQHPKMNIADTDAIVNKFIKEVKSLRNYAIELEFAYDKSRHKRDLYTNYFRFGVDRAYNAFYDSDLKKLNGENDFKVVSYLNNPFSSGDTEYDSARSKISKIHEQCKEALLNQELSPKDKDGVVHEEWITRGCTDSKDFFDNRLFSQPMQFACTDSL